MVEKTNKNCVKKIKIIGVNEENVCVKKKKNKNGVKKENEKILM